MAHSRLSLALALLAATAPSGQAAEQSPAVLAAGDLGARTVSYVYEAHATPPPGTKVLELWMPLPREEDQTLLALSLSGTAPATVVSQRSGDRVAYVRVTDPTGPVTLTQTATVARREVRAEPAASHASVGDVDRAVFAAQLDAGPAVQVNDEIRAIAARETAGKDTVVARARALYDWVFAHMEYDKSVPGWGLGDIPYCLKVGKGNCTDFHTLFNLAVAAAFFPFLTPMPRFCSAGCRSASILPIPRGRSISTPWHEKLLSLRLVRLRVKRYVSPTFSARCWSAPRRRSSPETAG